MSNKGNFWHQEIKLNEIMYRSNTKGTSFFPTKLYILQVLPDGSYNDNKYFACLNTNASTREFETLTELFQYIQYYGFDRSNFGSVFDGRTPSEYDYHLKKGSKVLEYAKIIQEIDLTNPLEKLKEVFPEEFV